MQSNLQQIGFKVTLSGEPWNRVTEIASKVETTPNVTEVFFGPTYPSPDSMFYAQYDSKSAGNLGVDGMGAKPGGRQDDRRGARHRRRRRAGQDLQGPAEDADRRARPTRSSRRRSSGTRWTSASTAMFRCRCNRSTMRSTSTSGRAADVSGCVGTATRASRHGRAIRRVLGRDGKCWVGLF